MSRITVSIEVQFLVPTLHVYAAYFNEKYPCTDEINDGSDMPINDQIKYATYNHLLDSYNKCKEVYDDAYNESIKKLSEVEAVS